MIELARNARNPANMAFWSSTKAAAGPGSTATSSALPVLAVDDPLVLTAAKDLARNAALQQATVQVATHYMRTFFAGSSSP